MISLEILYFLNLIITITLVVGTFYRIKLERDLVRINIENAKYKEAFFFLRKALETENLTVDELKEAIDSILRGIKE